MITKTALFIRTIALVVNLLFNIFVVITIIFLHFQIMISICFQILSETWKTKNLNLEEMVSCLESSDLLMFSVLALHCSLNNQ